jgi:hypothetical protein
MRSAFRLSVLFCATLLSVYGLLAQSPQSGSKAQEDFALAVARAHSRTSLFGRDAPPVDIKATAISYLALHGTGKGTYDNQWVDAEHWRREIRFTDFQQSEMRNDSGHSWIEESSDAMPIRIAQLLRFVVIHVPNSASAAQYVVSESSATGEEGEPTTCFSTSEPSSVDGYARNLRWCFNTATGLLVSQDFPLAMHAVFSHYVAFGDKQEYTKVHVTVGSLPVLDIDIAYSALQPDALKDLSPLSTMHRTESAGAAPNPDEWQRATVEYRYSPPLPPGTPDVLKSKPVPLHFYIGADTAVLDACVEDAPTEAMAEAALDAARKYTFTALLVDGKPVRNNLYESVWFQTGEGYAGPIFGERLSGLRSSGDAQGGIGVGARDAAGLYRNDDLSFSFGYPHDFVMIPRGQLEADLRVAGTRAKYGLDPHVACNTLLFKAQRLQSGEKDPEVISITDLDPSCVFGVVDSGALKTTAVNAAASIADHWIDHDISKPRQYKVNDQVFIAVSASGISRTTALEQLNAVVIVTMIHGHVLGWTFIGPKDDLPEVAQSCTIQFDGQNVKPLLPRSELP